MQIDSEIFFCFFFNLRTDGPNIVKNDYHVDINLFYEAVSPELPTQFFAADGPYFQM